MARPNYRRTARQQARAVALPQIQATRRGTRQEVRALRSEENPLLAGVQDQIDALKHAGLRRPEYEQAMEEAASSLANIPAGIGSQVLSAREAGSEAIGDLRTQEAASQQSILSQLQTAAAEHAQEVSDEQRSDTRHSAEAIDQEQLEKSLGLGSYAPDPLNPLEQAEVGKVQAETHKLRHPGAAVDRSESEIREDQRDHAEAAHYAREFFEQAKAGAIEGVDSDPKSWDDATWRHLVTAVSSTGSKPPIPAAERAVQAIRAHVEPPAASNSAMKAFGTVAQSVVPLLAPPALHRVFAQAAGY